jgi:hypothetical protein
MNGLEMPGELSGIGSEGDEGVGEAVVAEALAAVVIGAGGAGGDEDEIAHGVGDDNRPGVGAAGPRGAGHRVPRPLELAGDGVEAPDFAARHVGGAVVRDGGADYDRVVDNGGRRGLLVVAEPARRNAEAVAEVDDAVIAEGLDGTAGAGVDGDETRVDAGEEDAALAGSRLPEGDAAVGEVAVSGVLLDFGVVGPADGSGRGVEREDAAERRGEVEGAIDIERRGFECGGTSARGSVGVAGAVGPGDFELGDVVARDLLEGGEALAAGVVAVGGPVAGRRIGEGEEEGGEGKGGDRGEARHEPIMARWVYRCGERRC